jgi:hypothetical protein
MSNLQKEKRQQYQRRKSNTDFVFIKAEETQPFFMKETIRECIIFCVKFLLVI